MNLVLKELYTKHSDLRTCHTDIENAFELMKESYKKQKKLLVCGNGGSASDCEHIVGELMKGFMSRRVISDRERQKFVDSYGKQQGTYLAEHLQGALPAISLASHSALISAYANDIDADMVFAQQVYGYGSEGDIFLGISTSGNSKNVVYATQVAKLKGLRIIGLTGASGGLLHDYCDVTIRVPYHSTPEIQESHLPIYHSLCMMLEQYFFE